MKQFQLQYLFSDDNTTSISEPLTVEAVGVLISAQRSAKQGHQLLHEIRKEQQPFLAFFGFAKLKGPAYELYKLLLDQKRFLAAEDTVGMQIPQHHQDGLRDKLLSINDQFKAEIIKPLEMAFKRGGEPRPGHAQLYYEAKLILQEAKQARISLENSSGGIHQNRDSGSRLAINF